MLNYVQQPKDYDANLIKYKKNYYSQNGEDGILLEIFNRINVKNGWACEFGAWDGIHLSNTFNFVENHNWNCVMIEGDKEKYANLLETCKLHNKIIPVFSMVHYLEGKGTKLDDILVNYEIPNDFDLLSIDVDSCDFHIWKSLINYSPKVVVIEHSGINAYIIQREGAVHKKDIDGSTAFIPMKELGENKGYRLLCDTGNLIFVREDLFHLI